MNLSTRPAAPDELQPWRDRYRQEMNCQIIHDSLHARPGWTQSRVVLADEQPVGYGSIALGGPWKGKPTVFEFHLGPPHRVRLFDLFAAFLRDARAVAIDTQSNDPLLTVLLHSFADSIRTEAILFHDRLTTRHPSPDVRFRRARADDDSRHFASPPRPDTDWILEYSGVVAAVGGILFHYNPPYADLHMEVAEPFRRQGFGSYFVQELKRVCYALGHVPSARCNLRNLASRATLQRAGFVPCGNLVSGDVVSRPSDEAQGAVP